MDRRSFVGLGAASLAGLPLRGEMQTASGGKDALLVPAGTSRDADGKTVERPGWHFMVRTDDSGGRLGVLEADTPPDRGAPLHVHHDVDEWFYIVGGEFVAEVGGRLYRLKTGDSLFAPMRIPHRYSNAIAANSRILIGFAPGGRMERFFELLSTRPGAAPRSHDELAKLYDQFGMTLLGGQLTKEEIERA